MLELHVCISVYPYVFILTGTFQLQTLLLYYLFGRQEPHLFEWREVTVIT